MNQVKTGRFIAEMRKQQNLTQREFADILGISDKTVSKWECGNGMPELSLMQPVCKVLKTDLNELFSGERLTDADYKKKAEENMMALAKEAEIMKKNIVGGRVLGKVDNVEMEVSEAHKTNNEFWSTIGSEFLGQLPCRTGAVFSPQKTNCICLEIFPGKKFLRLAAATAVH